MRDEEREAPEIHSDDMFMGDEMEGERQRFWWQVLSVVVPRLMAWLREIGVQV